MGVFTLAALFVICISCQNVGKAVAQDSSDNLVIELLIVADYSMWQKWYSRTDANLTSADRVNTTEYQMKEYFGSLIHSSNTIFKSLETYDIGVSLKTVDLLFLTTKDKSNFTEGSKMDSTERTVGINEDVVFQKLEPVAAELQRTIPHDHIMVFTAYDVLNKTGGIYAGYAVVEATCLPKSMSIVEDAGFNSVFTIAHEIGHSLGSLHDGDGNDCVSDAGYVMDATEGHSYTNQWLFSSCSADYIQSYINTLDRRNKDCMLKFENTHIDPVIGQYEVQMYGQIYSHDQQCQIRHGPESYFCRNLYNSSNEFSCYNMKCKLPGEDSCRYGDAGDGTPCGHNKWCMMDQCVESTNVAINVTDECFAGEHVGVYAFATCKDIGADQPWYCDQEKVKRSCCESCAGYGQFNGTSTNIDAQCRAKIGPESYFCRGSATYDVGTYADVVCDKLSCFSQEDDGQYCLIISTDDKTSCGNKKWCLNGACVDDEAAPAVPDNCPWGDQKAVIDAIGLTCEQIKLPENHHQCYKPSVEKVCCATCDALRTNISDCEFGDKTASCLSYFADDTSGQTVVDPSMCYSEQNRVACCGSCAKYKNDNLTGCEYGDKTASCSQYFPADDPDNVVTRICYQNGDACCASCAKYRNDQLPGCEYGDKAGGCDPTSCSKYTASSRASCCDSCPTSADSIVG